MRLSQLRKLCECEQVAAVCYRVKKGSVEFLLVRTRGGGRWTFPKGSTEAGLTHAQAAALEAFEEAGVHGRIEEASFARYRRNQDHGEYRASKSAIKEFWSTHISAKCYGSVLRRNPIETAPGFLSKTRSCDCGRDVRTTAGLSSCAWLTWRSPGFSNCAAGLAGLIDHNQINHTKIGRNKIARN